MRDFVAGIIAVGLLLFAASLATTLTMFRRRRRRARAAEHSLGRVVVAEVPATEAMAYSLQWARLTAISLSLSLSASAWARP